MQNHVDTHDTQIAPVHIPRSANTPDPMSCIPKPSCGWELHDTHRIPQRGEGRGAHRRSFLKSTTAPLQDGIGLRKQTHQATAAFKSTATFSPTSRFEVIQQARWRLRDAVPFWEPNLNLLPAACASAATGWPTRKSQAVYCGDTRLTYATLQDTRTSVPL